MQEAGTVQIKLMADISQLMQQMDAAERLVKSTMTGIGNSIASLKSAALGFGASLVAGLSINAFMGILEGSRKAAAGLHDLAIIGGTTVEKLSGLASIGKYSEMGADAIVTSMNKLTKNLTSATDESAGTGKAIQALGMDMSKFKNLKPEDQMLEIAKAMDGFQDGAEKSAIMMALYGKEGAKMLPFMKDLAAAKEIDSKLTTEQANAADNLDDNMRRMSASSDAWKKQLTMGMIPAMDLAAQAYLDVMNGSGGLREEVKKLSADGSITQWTTNAITALTYLQDMVAVVWRTFKTFGTGVGAYAVAAGQLLKGDFKGASETIKSLGNDLSEAWSEQTLGQRLRARMEEIKAVGAAAEAVKPKLNVNGLGKSDKATGTVVDEYAKLIEKIKEKTAASSAELTQTTALTDGQKLAVQIMEQLRNGKLNLTEAQKIGLRTELEAMLTTEQLSDAHKNQVKAIKDAEEAHTKYIQSLDTGVAKLQEEIAQQQLHNEQIGLSKEAVAALVAAREMEKANLIELQAIKQLDRNGDEVAYNLLMSQANAIRAIAGLKQEGAAKEVAVEEAKKAEAAWTKFTDSVYNGLTDSLYRAFESGKGFFKTLWDGIVNTFKTTILKLGIQGVMGGITGSLGLAGSAAAQTASGGGLMSTLSTGNSVMNALTGGYASALGSGVSAIFGTTAGNAAIATAITGSAGSATAAAVAAAEAAGSTTAAATSMATLGTQIAGAMPYLAAAFAAYKVIASLTGGETRSGTQLGYHAGVGIDMQVSPSGGAPAGATDALTATVNNINGLLTSLGSHLSVAYFTGGMESSQNGKGFHYAGGVLSNNQAFGNGTNGQGYLEGRGSATIAEATAAYTLDLKKATIGALQAAGDIPKSVQDFLKTVDTKTLTDASADAIIKDIAAVAAFQQALATLPFEQLKNLTYDATNALLGAAGGADKLGASLITYYDKFYSPAEKAAQLTANASKGFADLGVTMPAVDSSTRAWYRAQVELAGQQDLSVAANAKLYYGLVALAGSVDEIAPAADAAAVKINDMANLQKTYGDLQVQLLQAQGKGEEALALQRQMSIANLDAESTAQAKLNFAKEDQIKAEIAAAEKEKAIADERMGLQEQLDNLTLNSTQLREKERNAIDESNRALYDEVKAAEKAKAVASERKTLQDEYNSLTMTSAQLLAQERDALDETNKTLFDKIQLEKQAQATAQEQISLYDRLDAVTMTSTQLKEKEHKVVDASNQKLADWVYALEDANKALASFGAGGIAKIISDALSPDAANKTAQDFATAFGDGIKQAMLTSMIGSISTSILNSIITPVIAGGVVTDAIMQGVVDEADHAVNRLAEIFNNPAFKTMLANLGTTVAGIVTTINSTINSAPSQQTIRQNLGPFVTGGNGPDGQGNHSGANPYHFSSSSGLEGVYGPHEITSGPAAGSVLSEWFVQLTTKAVNDRKTLQDQLDSLTLTNEERIKRQRDALDDVNKVLFDQVQAATKAKAIEDERKSLQEEYDQLTMTSAELRERERNALDETNRALFDRIQAIKDEKAAAQAAAEALQKEREAKLSAFQQQQSLLQQQLALENKNFASQLDWTQKLGVQSGFLNSGAVDRENQRQQALATTTDASTIDMINLFFDRLNLQAAAKVTSDYQRAMLEATGDTAGIKEFDRAVKDAALVAAGWSQAQIAQVHAAEEVALGTKAQEDFNRALMEANGDTAGIKALDRKLRDATLAAAGWNKQMIETIHAAEDAAAAEKLSQDVKRAMLQAGGDTAGLAEFDQSLKDAGLIAAGWTQAQVDALHALEAHTANLKVQSDVERAMLQATGNTSGLAAFDAAIKDAALIAAGWTQAQVSAVHAAEASAAAAKVQSDFQRALLEASGDSAGLAAFDQKLKDADLIAAGWTQAQVDQVNAMRSATAAAAAMKTTMDGIGSTRVSLQQQLLTAQGKPLEALQLKRDTELAAALAGKTGNDAKLVEAAVRANWALEDQISALNEQAAAADKAAQAAQQAAQAQQQAADQLRSAWQSVTDSVFAEVARIRGLMGGTSDQTIAQAQADFYIKLAQFKSGDQDAGKMLVGLSQNILAMASATAGSSVDLMRIQARLAASLEDAGLSVAGSRGLNIPSYDVGTNYVPHDMLAQIHEGEAIVPRAYNPVAGSGGSDSSSAAEVRDLKQEVVQLKAQMAQLIRAADRSNDLAAENNAILSGQRGPILTEAA